MRTNEFRAVLTALFLIWHRLCLIYKYCYKLNPVYYNCYHISMRNIIIVYNVPSKDMCFKDITVY